MASRLPRPRVPPQIEGRGNGIKTNVVNNVDIAKALERPPECEQQQQQQAAAARHERLGSMQQPALHAAA